MIKINHHDIITCYESDSEYVPDSALFGDLYVLYYQVPPPEGRQKSSYKDYRKMNTVAGLQGY